MYIHKGTIRNTQGNMVSLKYEEDTYAYILLEYDMCAWIMEINARVEFKMEQISYQRIKFCNKYKP